VTGVCDVFKLVKCRSSGAPAQISSTVPRSNVVPSYLNLAVPGERTLNELAPHAPPLNTINTFHINMPRQLTVMQGPDLRLWFRMEYMYAMTTRH
jgi:hypothetical protein